jgi:hypothetical protein
MTLRSGRRLILALVAFGLVAACTPEADGKKTPTSRTDRRRAARASGGGGGVTSVLSKVTGATAGRAGGAANATTATPSRPTTFSDVRGVYWRDADRHGFRPCGETDSLWVVLHPDLGVAIRDEYRLSIARPGQRVYALVNAGVMNAPKTGPGAAYTKQILIRRVRDMTAVIPPDCRRRG